MNLAGRVDGANTCGHLVDLGFAHCAIEGVNLPVGIGDAHIVQVEQADLAYPAARQRLGHPGAYTADADHRDVSSRQSLETGAAIQAGDAAETLFIDRHADSPEKNLAIIRPRRVPTTASGRHRSPGFALIWRPFPAVPEP